MGRHIGHCRGAWKIKRRLVVETVGRGRVDQHIEANGCHVSKPLCGTRIEWQLS